MTTTLGRKIWRRWMLGLLGLLALPLFVFPAYTQEEIEYARRLADFGYFELASHQLERIEDQDQFPESIRSYVPVVRSYIRMRKAEREDDLVKRVQNIEQALRDLRSFIEGHANHPRLSEARDTYAENLRKAGTLWITIAKRQKDKRKQAQESGVKHFQQAIKVYREIEGDQEGFDRCLNKLNQIIAHHELSRLFDQTGAKKKRQKHLQTVLKKTDDYLWSSCASKYDTLKIRARTYTALSHLEMSQVYKSKEESQKAGQHEKKAQTYFNSIRDLVDVLKQQQDLNRRQFSVINNLLLRAYRFWVEYLHENGNKDEALTKIEEIQIDYGNIKHPFKRGAVDPIEFKPGRAMLLLKAKIIHNRGARQQALDIVQKLSNKGGQTAEEAQQLVSEWSEALGPEPLTPEKILRMVDKSIGAEAFLQALRLIQKGRSKISSKTQRIKWEWKFLDRKALTYAKLERWYEAAVMYEHIHDQYHEVLSIPLQRENQQNQKMVEKVLKNDRNDFQSLRNMVLRANYLSARSYGMLRRSSNFQADMNKYKSLLTHLSEEHPDSDWANQTVLLSGDLLREREQYDQAIQKYDEPEKGSKVWEQGQVKKGYTYYLKGESLAKEGKTDSAKKTYLKGVKVLRSYLNYLESVEELTEDQRSQAWTAVDTTAYSYLRDAVEQPDQLLQFLNEDLLSRFNFSSDQMARAYRHRMNAFRMKGEFDKAADVAEQLYNQYPNATATTRALGDLADHFAKLRKNASSQDQKEAYRNKEVSFYYRWIVRKLTSGSASRKNVFSIAVKLRSHGIANESKQSLNRAQKLILALQKNTFEGTSVELTGEPVSDLDLLKEKALILTFKGEFDQATAIYKELGVGEGKVNELSVLNGRARLYMKQMERAKQEGNREKIEQLTEKAKQFIYQRILKPSQEEGEVWWRGWRTYLEVMLIAGQDQQASKNYRQLRKRTNEEGEAFGGNADLFSELLDKYSGKLNP